MRTKREKQKKVGIVSCKTNPPSCNLCIAQLELVELSVANVMLTRVKTTCTTQEAPKATESTFAEETTGGWWEDGLGVGLYTSIRAGKLEGAGGTQLTLKNRLDSFQALSANDILGLRIQNMIKKHNK